jgi:hypothetical protein
MQAGRPVNPAEHFVADTEFARFLRRETGSKDVFTMRFRSTDCWSVCLWRNSARTRFSELAALGKHPVGNRETVIQVKMCLPGNSLGERNRAAMRRKAVEDARRQNEGGMTSQEIEDQMEQADADEFLVRWSERHGARRYLVR